MLVAPYRFVRGASPFQLCLISALRYKRNITKFQQIQLKQPQIYLILANFSAKNRRTRGFYNKFCDKTANFACECVAAAMMHAKASNKCVDLTGNCNFPVTDTLFFRIFAVRFRGLRENFPVFGEKC